MIFGAHDRARARVISLGAGVQSTTLALMAAHGEIGPMPDAAVFADTGAESAPVYQHLRWLASGNVLPFQVHVVSKSNIYKDIIGGVNSTGQRYASIPLFLKRVDGPGASFERGRGKRQCTKEYKIEPIMRGVRELVAAPLGLTDVRRRVRRGIVIEQWIGISTDEILRCKPSRVQWAHHRWPLIERGMDRADCVAWLTKHDYPIPPKSACTFCPFRSDAEWAGMKALDPAGFAQAVEVDEAMRAQKQDREYRGIPYLHGSLKPLAEVDFSTPSEQGQGDLWLGECEGMCGV